MTYAENLFPPESPAMSFLDPLGLARPWQNFARASAEIFGNRLVVDEWHSDAPLVEPRPDFMLEENYRAGKIPEVTMTSIRVSPFCRVLRFTPEHMDAHTATVAIPAANSGATAQLTRPLVLGCLRQLDNVQVYVVEHINPRYVDAKYQFHPDESIDATTSIMRDSPGTHLLGHSYGGYLATIAAACEQAASLTVAAAPINPAVAHSFISFMAAHSYGQPLSTRVKKPYPGAGQHIVSDNSLVFCLENIPPDVRACLVAQSLPYAHVIHALRHIYRDNSLIRGFYEVGGSRVNLRNITCPTTVIEGEKDSICLPKQTSALLHYISQNAPRDEILVNGAEHLGLLTQQVVDHEIMPVLERNISKQRTIRPAAPALAA